VWYAVVELAQFFRLDINVCVWHNLKMRRGFLTLFDLVLG